MTQQLVVVHPDPAVLAYSAASRLLLSILDKQSVKSPVHIALTGGTVGIATLAQARELPLVDAIDWSQVHLWWGDERFLPEGDKDRNEVQAREAWLNDLDSLPQENIHYMPRLTEGYTVERAAADYSAELAQWAPEGHTVPEFDVVLLGMGPDSHVASLFPNHPDALADGARAIAVNDSPKPPAQRVSLTFDAITCAQEVWIIAAGAEKAAAVNSGLSGEDRRTCPVAGAQGTNRTLWLIDAAAAGNAAM